ncbi:hypothetical protein RIF29_03562 [Crotalaria pallida]|uniref:Uncharacterized protein n=1 Tax=Crotalaria pallida TaxID=3830 RepID=A0AAN9J136_CROPI
MILTVAPGLTEFACPTCRMPQMLPPELMARVHHTTPSLNPPPPPPPPPPPSPLLLPPPLPSSSSSSSSHVLAHGIDPTKIQLPCTKCKAAILNVPHGLARFACPQCGIELAVNVSKVKQFFPPEEVNEVRFLLLSLCRVVLFSVLLFSVFHHSMSLICFLFLVSLFLGFEL